MYQICGVPAPPENKVAHSPSGNNVNLTQPKADYARFPSSINLK